MRFVVAEFMFNLLQEMKLRGLCKFVCVSILSVLGLDVYAVSLSLLEVSRLMDLTSDPFVLVDGVEIEIRIKHDPDAEAIFQYH